jgi:fumarate hydratase class II
MIVGLKTVTDEFRVEEDALGDVQVPADHLWCAQVGAFARPALARGIRSSFSVKTHSMPQFTL